MGLHDFSAANYSRYDCVLEAIHGKLQKTQHVLEGLEKRVGNPGAFEALEYVDQILDEFEQLKFLINQDLYAKQPFLESLKKSAFLEQQLLVQKELKEKGVDPVLL